jgi:hypothetical protein
MRQQSIQQLEEERLARGATKKRENRRRWHDANAFANTLPPSLRDKLKAIRNGASFLPDASNRGE